ncbi:MAG: 4a-hydroxytetrahydrobiopterin dehydratase [Planctomycetaceae bacterium]|nr:4a-hydroxytetrahydrobiopterin dehydratase [Planctomycetaceae bacterium]
MDETTNSACSLADRECVPCKGGTPPLQGEEIEQLQEQLGGEWEVVDSKRLTKSWKFKDFRQALDFTIEVGALAEQTGHHPDIHLGWGKVTIELTTHKIGGLSEADFVMAAKIDTLDKPT